MPSRNICNVSIRDDTDQKEKDDRYEYIATTISSGAVDSYGTKMSPKTLQNFADALNTGKIQFKDSHDRGLGLGVSESGEYKDGVVTGTFRLRKGWTLATGLTSDQIIEGIKEGINTMTSVGFTGGDYICDICDNDLMSRSCNHYPNRKYKIKDDDGNEQEVKATATIDGARLVEVSAVDHGANPDAKILEKAQRNYQEGNLPLDIKTELEQNYNVRFTDDSVIINKTDRDGGTEVDTKQLEEQLRAAEKERDEAKAKVEELEPLAECGRAAREHMTEQALEAYKLTRGESFQDSDKERFESRAANLTFKDLVEENEHLRSIAPEKPEVEPGSKTEQPDNSGSKTRSDQPETQGMNPPWFLG